MNVDTSAIQTARNKLRFFLRQADGGFLPKRVPFTPDLREIVDEQTAQKLYDQLITELEQATGVKIDRADV